MKLPEDLTDHISHILSPQGQEKVPKGWTLAVLIAALMLLALLGCMIWGVWL